MFNIIFWKSCKKSKHLVESLTVVLVDDGSGELEEAYYDAEDGLFYGHGHGEYEGLPMDPQPVRFAHKPRLKKTAIKIISPLSSV